ncbi:MAG: RICIN domain-containing protein [Lachnospiraceae bacterium]|nr:RICIN domain-containing protein [Lachnospiraceae bacterium]
MIRMAYKSRMKILWIGLFLLACGWLLAPAAVSKGAAVQKDVEYFAQLEKVMTANSTKKIQYQRGKRYTKKNSQWKKAAVLPLTSAKVTFPKKGWYTARITMTSGKKKLLHIKVKKKTYPIAANQPIVPKAGYYYLIPKTNTAQAVEVQDSSCRAGDNVSVYNRGTAAGQVWQLEPAGKKRFRLKNANSGLYLGLADATEKETNAIQKQYQAGDAGLLFKAFKTGSGYYIKCVGNGQYLHTEGTNIESRKRGNNKAWKYKLTQTTQPESRMTVSGATYPTSLLAGSAFVLKGVIASRYTMTSLTAAVINANSQTVLTKTVVPNSCSYDLAGVDAAITFGKLAVGSYTYRVTATDRKGGNLTVINRDFTIYTPMAGSAKTLLYNTALINQIGYQSTGTDLEKKACASYALAYCNAILYGTAPSPHSYWLGVETVDCVWSKGGYTTYAHASEQAVLQAAYGQIVEGRPCVLHVIGNTSSQHWVTIIGFKNVTSVNALTAGNFIAIDPWDGAVITVSDKYRVKNTYRLAYKS